MKDKYKNALVLGYFGYENNQLDGQTVKTRNIFRLLEVNKKKYFTEIDYFDTQCLKTSKLNFLLMLKKIIRTDVFFYLPAHNNLKFFFPFIFFLSLIFKFDIHYVVVGGWLDDYIKKKKIHKYLLGKIKGIYPQTSSLVISLENQFGYKNVYKLDNFRFIENRMSTGGTDIKKIKLIFLARVNPNKGVNVLFELCNRIIRSEINNISIDIYGPIVKDYENEFKENLSHYDSSLIKYKGVVNPDDINSLLSSYDLMLFPTKYFTEGFPGSILDAYYAGVPSIVSEWKYAHEFINHLDSGIIVEFNNDQEFIDIVISVCSDTNQIDYMKNCAYQKGSEYSPNNVFLTLTKNLL